MQRYTDAPDIYHRACALSVLGSMLTTWRNRAVITGGAQPLWPNLWIILVGDAGDGRKSTAITMATSVLAEVDTDIMAPNETSPEGFLAFLEKRQNSGKGNDAATLFVQSEFSSLMHQFNRSYSQSLKPMLMDFYDVPAMFKRQLIRKTFELPQPRVSILGGIAVELLAALSKQEDWLGGFYSRCMLISGQKTRHLKTMGDVPSTTYTRLAKKLRIHLKAWRVAQISNGRPKMQFDKDARPLLEKLPDKPEELNLRLSIARATTHFHKIAAIEQIDEDPERPDIGKAAAKRALDFIDAWVTELPEIISACAASGREEFEGDRLEKRILRYIRKHGGRVRRIQLLRNCALKSKQLDEALRTLQDAKYVALEYEGEDMADMWVQQVKDEFGQKVTMGGAGAGESKSPGTEKASA